MSLIINDTQYAGTFASYFWLPATYGMDTVSKGAVHVEDGIKKRHTIGRVDFSNPLQPRQATPTSAGTFTIDGRSLEPQDIMIYSEFNPRDFESHWLAESLSPTLLARELPVTAENYMLQIALNRSLEQIENSIWMGSTAFQAIVDPTDTRYQLQFFDGFMKKMVNDSDLPKVLSPLPLTGGATTGSVKNVLDAMDALITLGASTKKALFARADRFKRLKFFVSVNTEQLYQTALTSGLTFKGLNTMEAGVKPYKGYEVVALAGFPENTILLCEGLPDTSSNLYLGMNSVEDNQLQLMRLQNNSELFFIKGLMKYDVQYGFSNQNFLYTTYTSADFSL
jgi:hypothetical protein